MREVNTHGAAGVWVWLRPSVCVRAIGARCRRGHNRQGSEVEKLTRATPGYIRDADRQTDGQSDRWAFTEIDTQFCKRRNNCMINPIAQLGSNAMTPAVTAALDLVSR